MPDLLEVGVMNKLYKVLKRKDDAISPVIGTILMVAATVIIAGAVYAAVNAYNGRSTKSAPDVAFKAQAMDTDGDGLEDSIKVTYLSGPAFDAAAVSATAKYAAAWEATDGSDYAAGDNLDASTEPSWSPGQYITFFATDAGDPSAAYVSVLVGDNIVLDQTLDLKE
jgi:flagellin-like protein